MSDRFEEAKLLLRKHDYVTVVQQSGDGCIVTYPFPKLLYNGEDIPRLVECFAIQRGEKPGFYASTSYDQNPDEDRFIDIPEYAMRLYIICEIAACNSRIPIHPSLLVFTDAEDKEYEDIEDIIPPPACEIESKREGFLYRLIVEARDKGFLPEYEKVADEQGVREGYDLIRKFYD